MRTTFEVLATGAAKGVLVSLLLLLGASCADNKATALAVAISSEAAIPAEIDEMSVEVVRGGDENFAKVYPLLKLANGARLPASLTLRPLKDESPSDPVTIRVRANIKGQQVVLRSATVGFIEEKTKLLRLPLRYSCYDFPIACKDGTTCIGGACKSDVINAAALPDLGPDGAFPSVGSSACFDASDTKCSKDRVDVPDITTTFVQAGCSFETAGLGGTPETNLNVFVLWAKSFDQAHLTVLDNEPLENVAEGWAFESGSKTKFKLSPSLCALVTSGDIRKVEFNRACATRTIETPICVVPEDSTAPTSFTDSPCHSCVYAPTDCSTKLDAAKTETASKPLFECAFSCPYDGHYDTKDECSGVGSCFFGCLAPFLNCDATNDCADYVAAGAWRDCVAALSSADATRCDSDCKAEGTNLCSATP